VERGVRGAPSLSDLQETLTEFAEHQAATSEVLRAIARSPYKLQPIFDTILDSATRLGHPFDGALRLREGNRLCLDARKGHPGDLQRWSSPLERIDHEIYAGVAGTNGGPVQIPDLAAHEAYHRGDPYATNLVDSGGTRTLLLVPMLKDDELIGVIILRRNLAQRFTDRQIGLFVNFAAQATIALETTRRERQYREIQSDLAHANRVAAVGQLTASIAHELNQPLAAATLNGNTALRWLAKEMRDIGEAKRSVEHFINDVTRASDIIHRLRDLTKKRAPQKDALDINATILGVTALARSEAVKIGVTVRTRLAPQLPLVQGDRVQLQQVMLNLIVNAIQAMSGEDDGGRDLEISTETVEPGGVRVGVRDTGPGLSEEASHASSNPSIRRSPAAWAWACRSAAQSLKLMADGFVRAATSQRGFSFNSPFPLKRSCALGSSLGAWGISPRCELRVPLVRPGGSLTSRTLGA
jgi:signal transduction histidine kinase